MGERGLCKPEVVGSIPIVSTMFMMPRARPRGFLLDAQRHSYIGGPPFCCDVAALLQRATITSQEAGMPGGKRDAAPYGVPAAKLTAARPVGQAMTCWLLGLCDLGVLTRCACDHVVHLPMGAFVDGKRSKRRLQMARTRLAVTFLQVRGTATGGNCAHGKEMPASLGPTPLSPHGRARCFAACAEGIAPALPALGKLC